ncbi:hypothetical protein QBC46DRAFT_372755 [Diplogelasinospora grovesii]|uniref:DUF6594 domain-containing protein n=1 Tax=Diplogelasinospora grovesii TaxID=303347 RepID=A0AAN6NFY6_9PEZI|nr:hypothetical protein QBC46DRAFT_372755 [Diplogelasinospora grovesii]
MAPFATDLNTAEKCSTGNCTTDNEEPAPQPVPQGSHPRVSFEISSRRAIDDQSAQESEQETTDCGKEAEKFMETRCRVRDHEDKFESGWPRLAWKTEQTDNMHYFRGFFYSRLRLLLYKMGRIARLEAKLVDFDMKHNENLRNLTGDQNRDPGHPRILDDQVRLLKELNLELAGYDRMVKAYKEFRDFRPCSRSQFVNMLKHIIANDILEEEAYDVTMDAPDDFVYIAKPLPMVGELMHRNPIARKLLANFRPSDGTEIVGRDRIELVLSLGYIVFVAMLIVTPIGILYLGDLSKPQSFGVVVAFILFSVIVAVTATTELTEQRTMMIVVLVCGYAAVLATFLAQLAGAGPQVCGTGA